MLRDLKFLRRNSGKNDEIENLPLEPKDSPAVQANLDLSRAPLNTIPEPSQNPKPESEASGKSKIERTPVKSKGKNGHGDPTLPLRTPEKRNLVASSKNRFGWPTNEPSKGTVDSYGDPTGDKGHFPGQVSRGPGAGNGGLATPSRTTRTIGRANSSYYSESNSAQSTPNRSVNKPPNVGFRNKIDGSGGGRWGNFTALYRGVPGSSCSTIVVDTVEVPHFDLKEDPSFWMEHNVQVLIRVRPLSSMEQAMNGYSRCLKQESSQTITWIGQPETRFTFDHVACETVDQETLFRMVGLPMVENCISGYNSCMFAYGQTGSGKTYTMLGEIEDLEMKPSPHRGMTPRIFEFLFARIQAEEETRRAERLKYNCKCSFLEIYNEQITDLLDPSSTNLLLREDVTKGVYVENLSEFEVHNVSDILKLLTQGSSNRKVAATNMNRESSRSHSVFTCIIESRWEKDSTTNLRFARLNLVDLAGSERQKTSGAEGDRLKEAANINKSLSTLGHVIMILVDVANGKQRHVPYRDSRLTFLLQDSLGGNSKTIIIANVSPSMCSAAETLNTLKFAQRAKLIQNNAVVNEDSTGDVIALLNQIRLLKGEVAALKCHNVSRALSFGSISSRNEKQVDEHASISSKIEDDAQEADGFLGFESNSMVRMSTKQLKTLETTLAGALRREQMTEASTKQLEAEIELLNRLVRQREEDTRCTKMMLKFREDKIQRMESLLGGSITADTYLLEENKALSEEIQLLQAKLDRNPEVTRFARENIRLLDQLRRFQEFYEEGEREMLLSEVSKLRDQLLQSMDVTCDQHYHSRVSTESHSQLKKTPKELEECKSNLSSCLEENAKLNREICDLRSMLEKINSDKREQDFEKDLFKVPPLESDIHNVHFKANCQGCTCCSGRHTDDILDLQLELDILNTMLKEQSTSQSELEEKMACLSRDLDFTKGELTSVKKLFDESINELKEAKSVIEALESQQILSINEIEDLQNSNYRLKELLDRKELEITAIKKQLSYCSLRDPAPKEDAERQNSPMEVRLKKMQESLEKAKQLNMWHQNGHRLRDSFDEETENVRRQAEAETAEVIVCLQEELVILQQQVQESQLNELEIKRNSVLLETELKVLQEKLQLITEENKQLLGSIEEKDREIQVLSEEWMLLSAELEEVLGDGDEALRLACDELEYLSGCLPQRRIWISEQCSQMVRTIYEKELLIEDLSRCLEDANSKRSNLESMLKSLRGAAVVITEAHQQECCEKENKIALLTSELHAKTSLIAKLDESVKLTEEKMRNASACATAAFVVVNRLSEMNHEHLNVLKQKDDQLEELAEMNFKKDVQLVEQAVVSEESDKQIESLRKDLAEYQDDCAVLTKKLSEERQHRNMMRQKLEDIEENNILKAKSKLNELKVGLTTVRSCMNVCSEHEKTSETIDDPGSSSSTVVKERICSRSLEDYAADLTDVTDLRTESSVQPLEKQNTICGCSCCLKRLNSRHSRKEENRDITIILLKAEIESALESLKQVQAELGKLRNENKERLLYEEQGKETMKCLINQLLALQAAMHSFEEQGKLKMETYNCKVDALAQILLETCKYCCKEKEMLEREVGDIEIAAAEKSAEASFILAKFEEAQDTLKEADIMINELMLANEKMKVDIEMLERVRTSLTNERDMLMDEVRRLRFINGEKDLHCERLERQIASHVMETRDLFGDLEADIAYFLETFKESLASFTYEFQIVKSLVLDSTKPVKLWLEDIWSEIVVRDCAVSSLHLCHMGILLETATGLNAENGLLQHGLRESNSLIADLRDHNDKSRKELEICRVLKGKLLSDIKNSFDRISRKEDETGDLCNKLAGFEKMILDLQFQEESMLKRSNYMGHQLTLLTKELDESNKNFLTSLFNQQKQLEAKEEVLSELEHLTVDLYAKDFESLILATGMQEMEFQNSNIKKRNSGYVVILQNIVSEMLLSQIDAELSKQTELDCMNEICQLKKEIVERERVRLDLLSKLSKSNLRMTEMDEMIRTLEHDVGLLKAVDCSNNTLKAELAELSNSKMRLENQIQYLEVDNKTLIEEVKDKEIALEHLSTHVSAVDQQNQKLEDDMLLLKSSLQKLQAELERRNEEQSSMVGLMEEHESLKKKIINLEFENSKVLQDLAEKKSEFDTSFSCIKASKVENIELKEKISYYENTITNLQSDLDVKNAKLNKLQHSQSFLMGDLHVKSQKLQLHADAVNKLERENEWLRDELETHDKLKQDFINNCLQFVDKINKSIGKLYGELETRSFTCLENVVQQIAEDQEKAARFIEEFECLDSRIKGLIMDNTELEAELLRKDDILKGLLFDISLLQESASNTKDQKDEIEEMSSSLKALEDELAVKLGELKEAIACSQELQAQVKEKTDMISALEQDIIRKQQLSSVLSAENIELKVRIEDALAAKASAEEELLQGRKINESLEMELTEIANALDLVNSSNECLKSTLNGLYVERDNFHEEVLKLKENLEKAKARAQENAVVAAEAQQIAEARENYAREKEEEVKLLEKSVEELERTINVLENKVDILQGEAERQCLLRQELELELQAIKSHMQNVENAECDVQRLLDEKKAELEKTLNEMDRLGRIGGKKDDEIAQLKAHISELNLHAEAQATEYKQKFKELEAMAEKVRSDGSSILVANSLPYKSEKNASRARGSGSPFKCIGLGLAQQMKSEKDEELSAARMRIEELESLFVNKQKEIFALNSKLAAAESMTHDVIRDLLGVKLDVTSYASLFYNHQAEKKAEKTDIQSPKSSSLDVIELKKQLKQFIEERQGWLEEIDRKQAELVSVQIALEKHRQHDQLLKTENELLKVENVNYRKKVRELEGEMAKLSGQQNLQQRIHHHAKIKEENNLLKVQNEELSIKLRRSEVMLLRVKEELARHRASVGKNPYINLDEEERLNSKLKEVEEERVQVAQKLLGLCVNVLKVAGFTKHASEVCPYDAEEALERLRYKMASMESELQDLKTKNRIINERIRLFELMPQQQSSPLRTDENSCRTPKRVSQKPFHPSFDR